MNIDIKALEAIEADKGIGVDDLLTTIAEALLHAYYAHRGEVEDTPELAWISTPRQEPSTS